MAGAASCGQRAIEIVATNYVAAVASLPHSRVYVQSQRRGSSASSPTMETLFLGLEIREDDGFDGRQGIFVGIFNSPDDSTSGSLDVTRGSRTVPNRGGARLMKSKELRLLVRAQRWWVYAVAAVVKGQAGGGGGSCRRRWRPSRGRLVSARGMARWCTISSRRKGFRARSFLIGQFFR